MVVRTAKAEWKGGLKGGIGGIEVESGAFAAPYGFQSRMEDGPGTNPEELIAAAQSGCFTMALAAALESGGHPARMIQTDAGVKLDAASGAFSITRIELETVADVPGLDEGAFLRIADQTKKTCPVSKALASVPIALKATLLKTATADA